MPNDDEEPWFLIPKVPRWEIGSQKIAAWVKKLE
jgi:hypothetical protein